MADKGIWIEFGVSEADWKKIVLEVEHENVNYKVTEISESEFIKKLFPELEPIDQLKILYLSRISWHAGRNYQDH